MKVDIQLLLDELDEIINSYDIALNTTKLLNPKTGTEIIHHHNFLEKMSRRVNRLNMIKQIVEEEGKA